MVQGALYLNRFFVMTKQMANWTMRFGSRKIWSLHMVGLFKKHSKIQAVYNFMKLLKFITVV
jgi:hypothetical protein